MPNMSTAGRIIVILVFTLTDENLRGYSNSNNHFWILCRGRLELLNLCLV